MNGETNKLVSIDSHPFWQKIDSDPEYREEIILYIQSQLESAIHTHKKYAHQFTDYDLHE